MDKNKALKLALEALEEACEIVGAAWTWRDEKGRPAITAIKQALEQPVQEPVATLLLQSKENLERNFGSNGYADWIYNDLAELLDTPPAAQRPWVGLTDEERIALVVPNQTQFVVMKVVEAKLKEKNT